MGLDNIGQIMTILDNSGQYWTKLDNIGQIMTILDIVPSGQPPLVPVVPVVPVPSKAWTVTADA